MGRRKDIHVRMFEEADGVSPNRAVPMVTVEIRVLYPPGQAPVAMKVLLRAIRDAIVRLNREIDADKP